ncbi:MAG: chloride channel protein [Actinobacteria bacterium]|nr:chloride channel protein [Actinomycetota bacterium]
MQIRILGERTRQVLLFAVLVGTLTGVGVAGFDRIAQEMLFERLLEAPLQWQVLAPGAGLLVAALSLKYLANGASPGTADEYVRNFHDARSSMDSRPLPGRMLASVATLGGGGALGYEGPSLYLGSAVGSAIQRRFGRFFSAQDVKLLLVCGAAAGVSAIFKAPATGLIFALEVPYREDLARSMLLPAGIASASSYLTFVTLESTAPIFQVSGSPPFDLRDLGGSLLLGILCGIGARLYTMLISRAKTMAARRHFIKRALAGGAALGGLALTADFLFGSPLTLGPGYDNLTWALDPSRTVVLVSGLFLLRAAATIATVAGSGVGGLFIPLVIQGALLGRIVGGLVNPAAGPFFLPLVGAAAFLSAGYRVPLAGVMFVAETTGRPGFIIPGLIASVVAQLFMGPYSASAYQRATKGGHLERRFDLPVSAALDKNVTRISPEMTIAEFLDSPLSGKGSIFPVVEQDGQYVGVIEIDDLRKLPHDQQSEQTMRDVVPDGKPVARVRWLLRDAMLAMAEAGVDSIPVLDGNNFVGIVTVQETLKLEELLRKTTS